MPPADEHQHATPASSSPAHDTWRPQVVHVWVTHIAGFVDQPRPGLLLGWRRGRRGWEGWVIWAELGVGAHGDGPYVRQNWIDATGIVRRS